MNNEILLNLVSKHLKTKYAGSFLGMLWAFINPLLLAIIIGFVFTKILNVDAENFYLFIIAGMLPWTFLATSLQDSAVSIQANASILKQFAIPRGFIPLSYVLANLILFLTGLLVVTPFFLMVNAKMILMIPLLFLTILLQLIFVSGLSLLFAVTCVYFRDMHQLLNTFLLFWLWLTPVFYSTAMIPPEYQILFVFNPMTVYVALYRFALLGSDYAGTGGALFAAIMLAAAVFLAGHVLFRKGEPDFLKRV